MDSSSSLGRCVPYVCIPHAAMRGKWRQCKQCNWCTPKGQHFCGGCGCVLQDYSPQINSTNPSRQLTNSDAKMSQGRGNGKGRGNGWNCLKTPSTGGGASPAMRRRWPRRRAEEPQVETVLVEDDAQTVNAEEERIADIKEQMESLNYIIASVKGRSDPTSSQVRTGAQNQLKAFRIQVTKAKPLPEQESTLLELVERKTQQCDTAAENFRKAQEAHRACLAELAGVKQQLAEVQDAIGKEEDAGMKDVNESIITAGQFDMLTSFTKMMQQDEAEETRRALHRLKVFLNAVGMTPTVSRHSSPSPPGAMGSKAAGAGGLNATVQAGASTPMPSAVPAERGLYMRAARKAPPKPRHGRDRPVSMDPYSELARGRDSRSRSQSLEQLREMKLVGRRIPAKSVAPAFYRYPNVSDQGFHAPGAVDDEL